MAFGRELKRRAKASIAPLVFLSITAYFGWSATQGQHGLVAYAAHQAQLRQVQAEHDAAVAERDAWEQRVAGLRAGQLDLDTLDERGRAMLNLADPTDVIVPYANNERLF